jgi:crotonobetainyl-CoA:carnitine CoA-transferase CaiB-like acyl-CoA transferase
MERLGVGYETLAAHNPRLIYCSVLGYDPKGEYRTRAGHDINFVGLTGLLDITRGRDQQPALPGLHIADVAAAMFSVTRVLQAVIERGEGGRGQRIEVDMLGRTAALAIFAAAPAALANHPSSWEDLMLNGQVACYNLYPTRDGRWLSVGNVEEKFWVNFCRTVQREDWIPEQFNRSPEFRAIVSDLFRTKTQSEWVEIFRRVDTCIEPVLTLREAADRHLFPYPQEPAPKLGEHTDQVLSEFAL